MANSAVVGTLKTMLTMDTAQYEAGARKAVSTNVALNKSLADTGKEVAKITPQAERMVKALGGDKLLYTANSLTQAITKMGGATRLTESEQVKANKTLSDAIAKYTLLGQKAPQAMIDLEKETRKSVLSTSALKDAVAGIGPAIVASFSVSAVLGFAKSMGEFAGQMNDLSAETGVSVEKLQALNYIAAGVGLTIDDVTKAVSQLEKRLGGDDKSALRAIDRLGLSFKELEQMAPDEMLLSIADGFDKITDQNERAALAADLFGKSGIRMLRLFDGNMRELIRSAETTGAVMSKELIDRADAFDDAWGQAIIRVKGGLFTIADAWVTPPWVKAADDAKAYARTIEEMARKVPTPGAFTAAGPTPIGGPSADETKRIEAQSAALLKAAQAAEAYRAAVARIYADIGGAAAVTSVHQLADAWAMLSPAQQANSVVVSEVLKRYEALRKEVGTNVVPALETLFRTTGTLINQAKPWSDAIKAVPAAIHSTADAIQGDLLPSAQGFSELMENAKNIKAFHDELVRLGMIAPQIADENDHVTDSVERQAHAWGELGEKLKTSLGAVSDAAIGHLGTLLFGAGHDNRQMKLVADEAHQDFLRIQRSGKATAEELTVAFKRWHDAEEQAQHGFGERFKDWAYGLGKAFMGVLDAMLQHFTEGFLKGIVKAIAGTKMGQAVGNWAGGLFGGAKGGGAAGGLASTAAGVGGVALLGGGAAAGGAISAGDTVVGTGLAGVGGLGGGMGASLAAFATNPFTIAAVGAGLLGLAVWKKGLFRGGEESLKVNKPRDKFIGQFGSAMGLAAKLTSLGAGEGGGALMSSLNRADKEKTFHSAEDNIISFFAQHGVRGVKKFNLGGFVPPGAVVPAVLHGGSMGEYVVPAAKMATGGAGINLHVHNYISTLDRAGVRQFVESPDFIDSIDSVVQRNHNFITSRIGRALKATP